MVAMEMGKKHYFKYTSSCKEDKVLYQKHESFIFEIPTDKIELTG